MKGFVLIFAVFVVHLAMSIKVGNSTVTSCVIGGKPGECILSSQCVDKNHLNQTTHNTNNTDGAGLIEIRFKKENCKDEKVCCLTPEAKDKDKDKDIRKKANSGGMKSSNLYNIFTYFVTMSILICALG